MGDKTGISWTDATWNVVIGCSRVSPGCQHCYAEVQAARIVRMGNGKPTAYDGLVKLVGGEPRWTGVARFVAERLAWPLSKRAPLRIFVNSMSDLFHADVTNEQIAAVFGVMAACPQHTFQILTQRPQRMREWFEWIATMDVGHMLSRALDEATRGEYEEEWIASICNVVNGWSMWTGYHDGRVLDGSRRLWPLPNVWLGVSVENQDAADERIPKLLATPAAVRFLSCEPLLGEVVMPALSIEERADGTTAIGWVIAGCESGPGARPCSVEWLRSLRNQCAAAGVPYFLKQGVDPAESCTTCHRPVSYYVHSSTLADASCDCTIDGAEACAPRGVMIGHGSKRKPGGVLELPYLDGVQHAAFPEPR